MAMGFVDGFGYFLSLLPIFEVGCCEGVVTDGEHIFGVVVLGGFGKVEGAGFDGIVIDDDDFVVSDTEFVIVPGWDMVFNEVVGVGEVLAVELAAIEDDVNVDAAFSGAGEGVSDLA